MSPAKKIIPLGIILCFLLSACRSAPYPDGIYAELGTERGTIVLELDFERTPMTTANFIGLAEGTLTNQAFPAGRPFFDGTVFHRVVPGHVIQAGIPNGGETDSPGYTIPNEIASDLSHDRAGILGMANAGPHTNSSQFYITLGDRSYLDGNFTIFGRVTEGIPVVRSIQQGDSVQRVKILRIGKKARRFRVDNDSFNRIRTDVEQEVARMEEEKKKKEAEWIRTNWPDAVQSPQGTLFQVTQSGTGAAPGTGRTLLVRYSGVFPDGTSFRSTGEDGQPLPICEEESTERSSAPPIGLRASGFLRPAAGRGTTLCHLPEHNPGLFCRTSRFQELKRPEFKMNGTSGILWRTRVSFFRSARIMPPEAFATGAMTRLKLTSETAFGSGERA